MKKLVAVLLVVCLAVVLQNSILRANSQTVRFTEINSFKTASDKLNGPLGVYLSQDNALFVADSGNKRILTYNLSGNPMQEFKGTAGGEFGYPVAVLSKHGRIYVADLTGLRIWVLDGQGKVAAVLPKTLDEQKIGAIKPLALAMDNAGNLYVADGSRRRIVVFNVDGDYSSEIKPNHAYAFQYVDGMVVNPKTNRLYALDAGSKALTVFDVHTGALIDSFHFPASVYSPRGLAVDPDTNLVYVSDMLGSKVYQLDLAQKSLTTLNVGGLEHPASLQLINKTLLIVDKDNNRLVARKIAD